MKALKSLVLLFVLLLSNHAIAATFVIANAPSYTGDSPQAACQAWSDSWSGWTIGPNTQYGDFGNGVWGDCVLDYNGQPNTSSAINGPINGCDGTPPNADGTCGVTCTAPLVPNGANDACVCATAGEEYYAVLNICAAPECSNGTQRSTLTGVCPDDCPTTETNTFEFSSTPPSTVCQGAFGCEARRFDILEARHPDGSTSYAGSYRNTGYACAGGEEPTEPFSCDPGTVPKSCPNSSVTYCMAPEEALQCSDNPIQPGEDTDPGTSTPEDDTIKTKDPAPQDTTTTTSTSKNTVDNGDGTSTRTTTTTTTKTNPDGSKSTTTKTTTETIDNASGETTDKQETETKTDEGDEGTSVAGNNQCAQQPTCKGDAIECATLFNSWEQKCLLKKTIGFCVENPTDPQCAEDESIGLEENEINLSITPVNIASNATCPTGFTAQTNMMGLITFDMGLVCDFMVGMNPFVLIFAWLAAAYIVISSVRGSD